MSVKMKTEWDTHHFTIISRKCLSFFQTCSRFTQTLRELKRKNVIVNLMATWLLCVLHQSNIPLLRVEAACYYTDGGQKQFHGRDLCLHSLIYWKQKCCETEAFTSLCASFQLNSNQTLQFQKITWKYTLCEGNHCENSLFGGKLQDEMPPCTSTESQSLR